MKMSFYSLIRQLQLGAWHELVAMHMTVQKPLCIPMIQLEYHISDIIMHSVISDFLFFKVCYIDKKDPNFMFIDIENILCMIDSLRDSLKGIETIFTMKSLEANNEKPERQLNLSES